MNYRLDKELSIKIAESIKSKAKKPFDNAYKAALATAGAKYVQGFLVRSIKPYKPLEHSWIQIDDKIIDPNLPHINTNAEELWYFAAHTLSIKQLKAVIEESKEDYPEDDPLPIYGDAPYEYYGDVMLGGKEYLAAYQAAEVKCKEIQALKAQSN